MEVPLVVGITHAKRQARVCRQRYRGLPECRPGGGLHAGDDGCIVEARSVWLWIVDEYRVVATGVVEEIQSGHPSEFRLIRREELQLLGERFLRGDEDLVRAAIGRQVEIHSPLDVLFVERGYRAKIRRPEALHPVDAATFGFGEISGWEIQIHIIKAARVLEAPATALIEPQLPVARQTRRKARLVAEFFPVANEGDLGRIRR